MSSAKYYLDGEEGRRWRVKRGEGRRWRVSRREGGEGEEEESPCSITHCWKV